MPASHQRNRMPQHRHPMNTGGATPSRENYVIPRAAEQITTYGPLISPTHKVVYEFKHTNVNVGDFFHRFFVFHLRMIRNVAQVSWHTENPTIQYVKDDESKVEYFVQLEDLDAYQIELARNPFSFDVVRVTFKDLHGSTRRE